MSRVTDPGPHRIVGKEFLLKRPSTGELFYLRVACMTVARWNRAPKSVTSAWSSLRIAGLVFAFRLPGWVAVEFGKLDQPLTDDN